MRLHGETWEAGELRRRVGRLEQVGGVRLVTLGDGAERGVRVLEFRTGAGFDFDVLVDRCFDVGRCALHGRSLAWESPTGFAHPHSYESAGVGFLRTFGGGLLTTCGLDHVGDAEEGFVLHGRATSLPARLAGYGTRAEADGGLTLWAEGEVTQAAVYGERLVLRRRIEARVGETCLRVADTVTNEGHVPAEHMLLYHVNAGFPVLDEGAELLVPARSVRALGGQPVDGYTTMHAPRHGWAQETYEHDNGSEPDGRVPVALVNRARGLGLYEVYRRDQFPYHWCWRELSEGTYVVGLEPVTNSGVGGRAAARASGELIVLEPGETRPYEIELGALHGAAEIDAFAARVAAVAR